MSGGENVPWMKIKRRYKFRRGLLIYAPQTLEEAPQSVVGVAKRIE